MFITHVSASLVTSIMDPAEASVRRRKSRKTGGFLRAVFDRKKHKRVIENHYCNLCDVKVYVHLLYIHVHCTCKPVHTNELHSTSY